MWLFDKYVQWRTDSRIHSLEQGLAEKPTPQLYLQLADAHKEAGNQAKSAQVLKLGAARYPNAPEIVRRQADAEKAEREMEKKRLVERIQSHPNPILYARLAELYKADDELTRTIDTCQRGIKAFPKYGGTYLVLGQIFADKKQWPEAVAQLEKSVALDKYNYLALKLLASVYMQLDRPTDAIQRLDDILFFAPGDEGILELQRKARAIVDAANPKSIATQTGAKTGSGKPQPRPSSMPNVGRPMSLPPAAPKVITKDQALAKGLADLRLVAGVNGAILVDQYGLIVAANLDASLDEGLVGALITNVYRTASNHSVKLGVGQFEEGVIEGADGNIHIVQFDDMILTIFAKSDAKHGLLEKSIRDFAETALNK
ncbi:MAG: roadblock/LC7 domain-containing protein [Planctomycetota bacterium]